MTDKILEPCRRTSGSYRAYFNTQEEAQAFARDPMNIDYHGDIAHHCHKCLRWHLSRPEWLAVSFNNAQPMTGVN